MDYTDMPIQRLFQYALLAVAVAAAVDVGYAQATKPAKEDYNKLVRDMYGRRIAKAKASPADRDNLELAKELLAGAMDDRNPERLRLALARTALDVATPVGTETGLGLSRKAIKAIDNISPLGPIDRTLIERDLALAALQRGRLDRLKLDQIALLARKAAKASLQYVEAALPDEKHRPKAATALVDTRRIIQVYRLNDLADKCAALQKEHLRMRAYTARLKTATAQWQAAKKAGQVSSIRTAGIALAQVHLEYQGDILAAAKYLAGTDDPREPTIAAAAAFLQDPSSLDKKTSLHNIKTLLKLAHSLPEEHAKQRVATCALQMCQALTAGNPPRMTAAKARLLITQIKAMLSRGESDKFRRDLAAAYKGIQCKVEVLEGQRIRATYNFATDAQKADWTVMDGTWDVGRGVLGCKSKRWQAATVINKLQFSADKPFKLRFSATGARTIGARINVSGKLDKDEANFQNNFVLKSDGLYMEVRWRDWKDKTCRLNPKKVYRFEITSDGKGTYSLSLNGAKIKQLAADKRRLGPVDGSLTVRLFVRGTARRTPAVFDDIVLEGHVITKP